MQTSYLSHDRLADIHKMLDPPGTSLKSCEELTRETTDALDTLYFELLAGTRDSALSAFRNLHADEVQRLHERRDRR